MIFEKRRIALAAASVISALIAIVGLGGSTSCSLIVSGLCTSGCGAQFVAGFGGEAGSAGNGGDTGGTGGTTTSGGGGTGGTTTTGGGGTGGTGCDVAYKDCGGDCVMIDDPLYGCDAVLCEPCVLPHAIAICGMGVCAIEACSPGFEDCANGASDGCEQDILTDKDNCGGCGQACTDYPNQQCQAGKCKPGCGDANVPVSTEGYALCFTITVAQHSLGMTLGIGGEYVNAANQTVSAATFLGCQAQNALANEVVCNGLDLKSGSGSSLKLNPYYPIGQGAPIFLCEATTFSEKCTGIMTLYGNGEVLASFEHPADAQDLPFDYCDLNGRWAICIADPDVVPPLP